MSYSSKVNWVMTFVDGSTRPKSGCSVMDMTMYLFGRWQTIASHAFSATAESELATITIHENGEVNIKPKRLC